MEGSAFRAEERRRSSEHSLAGGTMNASRQVRIAVSGDLHFDGTSRGSLKRFFMSVAKEADILALVGDLTTHGEPEQVEGLVQEMEGLDIPVVTVLGNHDCEAERASETVEILRDRGIHVLDGENVVIEGIGFAGVKGFGGGFGRGALGPFGERLFKEFVQAALDEALKLETALRSLDAVHRIVLLHYAPIPDTLVGEPEAIFPWLGSSRLLPPIETYRPNAVFHGHAHIGSPEGRTPSGVPVYNVAAGLLDRHTGRPYRIWTAEAPDRRRSRD
jgi:Icc-related predicted phosphoesterase